MVHYVIRGMRIKVAFSKKWRKPYLNSQVVKPILDSNLCYSKWYAYLNFRSLDWNTWRFNACGSDYNFVRLWYSTYRKQSGLKIRSFGVKTYQPEEKRKYNANFRRINAKHERRWWLFGWKVIMMFFCNWFKWKFNGRLFYKLFDVKMFKSQVLFSLKCKLHCCRCGQFIGWLSFSMFYIK